jgi:hypothetical protein
MKRMIALFCIILTLNSCITLKVDKDSRPLVDFGVPIVGQYRNKDYVNAIIYTVLALSFLTTAILFTPNADNKSGAILPVSGDTAFIVTAASYGSLAGTCVISSIDSAVSYNVINDKILKLNNLKWDPYGKLSKHEQIIKYREDLEMKKVEEAEIFRMEQYKKEAEIYKQKLIDDTITSDELLLIERSDFLKDFLKDELGYYKIKHKNSSGQ